MNDLIKLAEELGAAIEESAEFKSYQKAKELYDSDTVLQDLIKEFNLKKMAVMQEMQNKNRDEEKLSAYQIEMRDAYSAVISNPASVAFNDSKDALERIVNEIYGIINFHVTGQQPGACSGSCGECGGCM